LTFYVRYCILVLYVIINIIIMADKIQDWDKRPTTDELVEQWILIRNMDWTFWLPDENQVSYLPEKLKYQIEQENKWKVERIILK